MADNGGSSTGVVAVLVIFGDRDSTRVFCVAGWSIWR